MSEFIQRIIEEKKLLDEKIIKLEAFIMSQQFNNLDKKQKNLLQFQILTMISYSDILVNRLNLLGHESNLVPTENPGLGYIFGASYVIVDWPEVQDLMEEDWFENEAILNPEGSSSYFVPVTRIHKFLTSIE